MPYPFVFLAKHFSSNCHMSTRIISNQDLVLLTNVGVPSYYNEAMEVEYTVKLSIAIKSEMEFSQMN